MARQNPGKLIISGGNPLQGVVHIAGAKNSALKLLAGSILACGKVTLCNLPHLHDITFMMQLLAGLGCDLNLLDDNCVEIDTSHLRRLTIPYELIKAMRASIVLLGPLLTLYKAADVALPGGCAIGVRPVDIHLEGLRKMGADIQLQDGFIKARVQGKLKGADIKMHTVTVTGTENLMMAATLAEGKTILRHAAREPEVVDLANFLIKMGAKIEGAGTSTIRIEGVDELKPVKYSVIPDRIEAGTYLVAGAITGGKVTVKNVDLNGLENIIERLEKCGAKITSTKSSVTLDMQGQAPKPVDIKTAPHPGFPTDMQAQFMALNCIAKGKSKIQENIWENRFMHVPELHRMGADIVIKTNAANITGVEKLSGAPVTATDLRASASLVLAGLAADGITVVEGVHHMDRGYEYLEEKLLGLGADIHRVGG